MIVMIEKFLLFIETINNFYNLGFLLFNNFYIRRIYEKVI